jgi:hypothetical protein
MLLDVRKKRNKTVVPSLVPSRWLRIQTNRENSRAGRQLGTRLFTAIAVNQPYGRRIESEGSLL